MMSMIPNYQQSQHMCDRCGRYHAQFLVNVPHPTDSLTTVPAYFCSLCARAKDSDTYKTICVAHNEELFRESIKNLKEIAQSGASCVCELADIINSLSRIYSTYADSPRSKEYII